MRNIRNYARGTALAGLVLMMASPALADEKDRAQRAIAEADAKISAALQVQGAAPAAGDTSLSTEAQASLREAREQLGRGHERQAINAAMKASELADRALADGQKAQAQATNAAQAAAQGAAMDAAAATAANAQQQAADANARAAAAEQAASAAASDAAAARAHAAAAAATPPAPAQTTITTQTETSGATVTSGSGTTVKKAPVRKRTTTRTTRVVPKTKTTTTVETKQ